MPFEKDPNELGALWERTNARGGVYLTGTIGDLRVVVFRNDKAMGKQPQWRVLKAQPRPSAEPIAPVDPDDVPF